MHFIKLDDRRHSIPLLLRAVVCLCLLFPALLSLNTAVGQEPDAPAEITEDLEGLSLEELMNITVTSVSKRSQPLSDAPAAVFVITAEDIRRSGVTNIPDALRMVPGMNVSRIDSNKWAVSPRGFNIRFANKVLVLIDGRTVYTPFFSGTYWENQDLVLDDIERIEVIRGPGATLWGSNAVNGVINIITKHARDTQGGLVTTQIGTEDLAIGQARYGGKVGDNTYYRVYTKYSDRDELVNAAGNNNNDDWYRYQGGFRIDSELSEQDSLMVQGGFITGKANSNALYHTFVPPYREIRVNEAETSGANLMTRWERTLSDTSDLALQIYYNYSDIRSHLLEETRHTFDIDFQHRFQPFEKNEFIWGWDYRFTTDDIQNSFRQGVHDPNKNLHYLSAFVQDEITLIEDELRLILGSKFDHNDFTGLEIQPNARLIWTPHDRHTVWASVSRAVRTPSRTDHNAYNVFMIVPPLSPLNPLQIPAIARANSTDPDAENLMAIELGYRTAIGNDFTLDTALFYHVYDEIRNGEPGSPFIERYGENPFIILPFESIYNIDAESYGIEASIDWQVTDWWTLKPAYSFLATNFDNVLLLGNMRAYADNELHNFSLRSQMDLTDRLELDFWVRYVGNLTLEKVPAYLTLDTRIGWKPKENLEFSVGAQNVLDDRRPEFFDPIFEATLASEVQHSIYAKVTWRF